MLLDDIWSGEGGQGTEERRMADVYTCSYKGVGSGEWGGDNACGEDSFVGFKK